MPKNKNPCLGGYEIYNFGKPILVSNRHSSGVEKILKEIHQFFTFVLSQTKNYIGYELHIAP